MLVLAAGSLAASSRLGQEPGPHWLNVNGDDAAAASAAALGADELLLVSDVAGVLLDDQPVPLLGPEEAPPE